MRNEVIFFEEKAFILMNLWIIGKNLAKINYQKKENFIVT